MAKPIKNTPILWGNDAREFLSKVDDTFSQADRERERKRIDESLSELSDLIKRLNIQ